MRNKLLESFIKCEHVPLQTQRIEIIAQPAFLSFHDLVPGRPSLHRQSTARAWIAHAPCTTGRRILAEW